VLAPPGPVLLTPPAEVPRVPLDPRPLRRRLARSAARRLAAGDLTVPDAHVRHEPPAAEPARPTAPTRRHARRLLAARRGTRRRP
jgi:hypothetical protein